MDYRKEKVCESADCNTSNEEIKKDSRNISKYIVGANDIFIPTPELVLISKLESSRYSIGWDSQRQVYTFQKEKIVTDELLMLPNSNFEEIINDISFFWENRHVFKKYKFTFKRGILLYGEPGCGKSCLTALLSDQIINKYDGLVFVLKDYRDLETFIFAIPILRQIEPDRKILVIFEDLDSLCNSDSETMLLNLLDGINQIENCVYIGCTNYPEKLKERILNRPSRFDRRYHIGKPSADVRKFYFQKKIHPDDLKKLDLDDLIKKTESLSIAHLGEIIKSVFIYKKDLDETIQILSNMNNYISSSQYERKTIGLK